MSKMHIAVLLGKWLHTRGHKNTITPINDIIVIGR